MASKYKTARDQKLSDYQVSIREKVLSKLRLWIEGVHEAVDPVTGEMIQVGEEATESQLNAAELLGNSIGLFKDVVIRLSPRSMEELEAELEQFLADDDSNTKPH